MFLICQSLYLFMVKKVLNNYNRFGLAPSTIGIGAKKKAVSKSKGKVFSGSKARSRKFVGNLSQIKSIFKSEGERKLAIVIARVFTKKSNIAKEDVIAHLYNKLKDTRLHFGKSQRRVSQKIISDIIKKMEKEGLIKIE